MLGSVETNYDVERIVLMQVTDYKDNPVDQKDILNMGMKRKALLMVDIDAHDKKVISIVKTSGEHKWGSMPMPTF